MTRTVTRGMCIAAGILTFTAGNAWAVPTVTSLGVLPGGTYTIGTGVSSNGAVVVGYGDIGDGTDRAFRWTAAGGLQNLGVHPGGNRSSATAVSANGRYASGTSTYFGGTHGFRWDATTDTMEDIGQLAGGSFNYSGGYAISVDGSTVVGNSFSSVGYRAHRWVNGAIENLGQLPGGFNSDAHAVNADGSVVAGLADSPSGTRAFRWTAAGGMQNLGIIGGASTSYVWAMNGDGSVLVGKSDPFGVTQAMRWTAATGMQSLGLLPGSPYSSAQSISADGTIIVGVSALPGFSGYHGFIWKSDIGMVDLNTYLQQQGADLTGWTLSQALTISADGSAITGHGIFNGQPRGFVVRGLPGTCCPADFNCDHVVDFFDYLDFVSQFSSQSASADFNSDGTVDFFDYLDFVNSFSSGC